MRLRPFQTAGPVSLCNPALERSCKNGQGMRLAGGAYRSGTSVAFAPQFRCRSPGLCRCSGLGRFPVRRPLAHSCLPGRIVGSSRRTEAMKSLIDIHVHMAAFPDGRNGCLMSPSFQKGLVVWFIKRKMGIKGADPLVMNQQYVDRLVADVNGSTRLFKTVLLAFDGVYDETGQLDSERTTCLISNEYVAGVVSKYPDLFFLGASINPQRRDAVDELDRVLSMGAKLVKILPNSQAFDPSNSRYKPFYRALADKKVPLLAHVGAEHTFTVYDQNLGSPEKLQTALEAGAIVIGAHGCGSNSFVHGKFYATFLKLMAAFPNFFIDLSALSLPTSAGMIFYLRRHPEYFNRYLFGTDYPLSAYATPFVGHFGFIRQCKLWNMRNTFDKQAAIIEGLGMKLQSETTMHLLKVR
jgi:uncharacterized protein